MFYKKTLENHQDRLNKLETETGLFISQHMTKHAKDMKEQKDENKKNENARKVYNKEIVNIKNVCEKLIESSNEQKSKINAIIEIIKYICKKNGIQLEITETEDKENNKKKGK